MRGAGDGRRASRLRRLGRRLAALAALAAVVGLVGWRLAQDQLDEEIRAYVEAELQASYPYFVVRVPSARRVSGEGIEIRGLTIVDPRWSGQLGLLLRIERVVVECDTDVAGLVSGRIRVEGLRFEGPVLQAVRGPEGAWNAARLWPPPRLSGRGLRLAVTGGEVRLVDVSGAAIRRLAIRDVEAEARPEPPGEASGENGAGGEASGRPVFRFRGSCSADAVRRVVWEGRGAPGRGQWTVGGEFHQLEAGPALRAALPWDVAACWPESPAARGVLDGRFRVTNVEQVEGCPRFSIAGTIREGRMEDPRWPHSLTGLTGRFACDNWGVVVEELTGRAGPAQVRAAAELGGWGGASPVRVEADVDGLPLDERLAASLPEAAQAAWRACSPSGWVDAHIRLAADGLQGPWRTELTVRFRDASFAYDKFPYPLRQADGMLRMEGDALWLEQFTARAAGRPVAITGRLEGLGTAGETGWLEVRADTPIPIDQQLLEALPSQVRALVESFHPAGALTFWGRFEKARPGESAPRRRMRIGLRDCSVRYDKFPYPLEGLRGVVEVDGRRWRFVDLEARNDTGRVVCRGEWAGAATGEGGVLTLDFNARDVPLEDELRDALSPAAQRLWRDLRPRGVVDQVGATLRYESPARRLSLRIAAQKWPPSQNVETRTISIEPAWLPYRLDNVTGAVVYENGRTELRRVRAVHGRTTVRLDGQGVRGEDGRWSLELRRFAADRVVCDRELLGALPPSLARALARLQPEGLIDVDGQLTLVRGPGSDSPPDARWNVVATIEDGAVQCGLPVSGLRGEIRLAGARDGAGFRTSGQLVLDSAVAGGLRLTGLSGPFWADQRRVVFGAPPADPPPSGPLGSPLLAEALGGRIRLDGELAFGEPPRFVLRCQVEDADLAEAAVQLPLGPDGLSGRVSGWLHLAGSVGRIATWRGQGAVRLREADLYELPVVVALLSLLSVRPPETTAFTAADVDCRILGDRILLDRIHLSGDAISLRGRGEMDLQRRVRLQFYTMVGRDEIWVPILRPVLGEASRQFLLIEVVGTLDEPVVNKTAFPKLNETLRRLFPELTAAEASRAPIGREATGGRPPRR